LVAGDSAARRAASLAFNPRLPESPGEAGAADVGELDLRIEVGLAKDCPGPTHESRSVDFGRSSADH
jgi:hypothetical protein